MSATTNELVAMARLRDLCRTGQAKAVRVGAVVTLEEIAAVCHVTPGAVSLWERNKRTARGQHALDYLAALEGLMSR